MISTLSDFLSGTFRLAAFETKKRSYGSYLGWLWSIMSPLSQIFVFYFAVKYVFKAGRDDLFLWLTSGLAVWNVINTSMVKACNSLLSRRALLQSSNAKMIKLVFADLVAEMFVLAPLYLIAAAISIYYNGIHINLLFVPLLVLTLTFFLLGLGVILAVATPFFRDLPHLMTLGLSVMFWFTPIAYSKVQLSEKLRLILYLNPFTYFVEFSQLTFGAEPMPLWVVVAPILITIVITVMGFWFIEKIGRKMVIIL
tara:strand:+ start:2775 stop:3536 length:762 start_codon:yes stop_codon:yes gene_type:complete